jgi:hypothetical protein
MHQPAIYPLSTYDFAKHPLAREILDDDTTTHKHKRMSFFRSMETLPSTQHREEMLRKHRPGKRDSSVLGRARSIKSGRLRKSVSLEDCEDWKETSTRINETSSNPLLRLWNRVRDQKRRGRKTHVQSEGTNRCADEYLRPVDLVYW